MAETSGAAGTAARRQSALAGIAGVEGNGLVTELGPAARFSLRAWPAIAAEIGVAAGFDLAGPVNSVRVSGERLSARLGPNEWLLIAPEGEGEEIPAAIGASFGDRFHALIDIGHRNVAFSVGGPHAADILNAGCPLDLSEAAFPPGMATRTLLGKAEIVLMRPGGEPSFRVECWRSFARYVYGFLTEAAREFR